MFPQPQAESHSKMSCLAGYSFRCLMVRDSLSRAQVIVTRRVFGEFVVNESVSIFFMELVGFIHSVPVGMLESFPVFGFDAFAQRMEM